MALVAVEKPAGAANWKGGGKTNTEVATAGRSEFEQQDIAQAIMPAMSWPQSM
jgi:hypothetical protein